MMQKTPLTRSKPMRRTAFKPAGPSQGARRPIKSKGMKGRAPTADEERLMHAIGGLGCIACLKDGNVNPWISLHHIDGRTKPGAHLLVLPLCAGHHQAGTGEDKSMIAVHPDKARFEARYGTQHELLAECIARVEGRA